MKRNERGVSLIALVITIIVIIILAAIAFSSSTRTITEANKSNIINNISEVSSAFHTKSVTVEGKKAAEELDTVTEEDIIKELKDNIDLITSKTKPKTYKK